MVGIRTPQDSMSLKAIDNELAFDIDNELLLATQNHGGFNSAHEGWAVIYEEVHELWAEVLKKRVNRDKNLMRKECVQIAAMAIKFIQTVCDEK
jgi:hypothetical protein